jgi:hypothetical protein
MHASASCHTVCAILECPCASCVVVSNHAGRWRCNIGLAGQTTTVHSHCILLWSLGEVNLLQSYLVAAVRVVFLEIDNHNGPRKCIAPSVCTALF